MYCHLGAIVGVIIGATVVLAVTVAALASSSAPRSLVHRRLRGRDHTTGAAVTRRGVRRAWARRRTRG